MTLSRQAWFSCLLIWFVEGMRHGNGVWEAVQKELNLVSRVANLIQFTDIALVVLSVYQFRSMNVPKKYG